MIFVDANVLMYAVGGTHPARDEVHQRLATINEPLATSTEVLQELLHRYVSSQRRFELDRSFMMANDLMTIWTVDLDDIILARRLSDRHADLSARDLVHLTTCINHGADDLWTYDRGLKDAWSHR